MSAAKKPPTKPKPSTAAGWQEWVAILLVAVTAIGMALAQVNYAQDPTSQLSLSGLGQRAEGLARIKDPIQRDSMCVPLAAYSRSLDRALPKDARIFMAGMIGETNSGKMGYYFFLRNYLFPREIGLSGDGKPILTQGGCLGVPCDSPTELQKKGFDLMISQSGDGSLQLTPLTEKGMPK